MSMRALVDTHYAEYPWEQNTCYEPRPDLSRTLRNRRRVKIIFAALAILSVITGMMYALSN